MLKTIITAPNVAVSTLTVISGYLLKVDIVFDDLTSSHRVLCGYMDLYLPEIMIGRVFFIDQHWIHKMVI